jgi:predicted TIM-barrel fold metal-dependent hydrolase
MKIIDFENHFFTADYLSYLSRRSQPPMLTNDNKGHTMRYSDTMISVRPATIHNMHLETGDLRIREMDESGVDIEVLSISPPGVQRLGEADGTAWSKKINNDLAQIIKRHPDRFYGLGCVAPQSPKEASDEVERIADEHGFKGLILHPHIGGEYLDGKRFRPIFKRAAKLGMPIFLHPELPSSLILPGFEEYGFNLAGTALGFAMDVALCSMRLICSGLFDELPELQIVLGHLGEGLPFWLQRVDTYTTGIADPTKLKIAKKPGEYIKTNFTVLTSGMHYLPAFMCAYLAMGPDRIALGTDYPYDNLQNPVNFIKDLNIPEVDKEKIFCANITRLLKI